MDAEKRRAIGLAPAVTSVLESHRAAQGSLRAFMDWCTMVATVAADVERALADAAEEESAALGAAAELALARHEASGGSSSSGSASGGSAVVEAAAALSAAPLASAARTRAYAHELRGLYASLLSLLQAMLDGACGALLDRAEDYSGEAKGVKELLSVDAFAVHAGAAAASPSGVRVAPGPFVRRRSGGEMVIWGSMTGQRVNRNPKPFSGPTVEVEFQKGCLGTAVNVAVRVNTLCTASERVPGGAQGEGGGAGGGARAKPRPKSALKAPPVAAAAAAAAVTPAAGEEGKEGVEGGEEGKSGEGEDAAAAAAAAAAAPKPSAAAAAALPSVPLRPLGGWVCLDQLLMPPPNFGIRGWAMTPAAAPPSTPTPTCPLLRMEHPAASNASAASTTSVKVKWRIPSHIVLGPLEHVCPPAGSAAAAPSPRALFPGRWSAERGEWSTESVLDPSFHAASRTVQFNAIGFVPHALLQPLAADLPYRAWRLTPHAGAAPGLHAAVLHITTARGIEVALHCAEGGCTLLAPRVPELAFLTHGEGGEGGEGEGDCAGVPCLPPGQMLASLRACGLHLAPSDSDAPAVARLLEEEGGLRALAPLLPPCVEAALHADMAHAAASFTLEGVAGRGYVAGQAPPDPTDAPPNADAAVLAQVRALETLVPLGAGHTAGEALAWRAGASAMQRITVREDRGLPRGCSLQAAPEGGGGAGSAGSATFAALDACLLASAAPEASAWLASAPPVFTETVRRLLCMVRPLNFSA